MPFATNPSLEAAVVADSENDLPRLVYADWLDEHGDPARAAFIRVQIALYDKHPADADFIDLELTQDELVAQLTGRNDLRPPLIDGLEFPGYQGLDRLVRNGYFERGFPHAADVHVELNADILTRMLQATTLRGLRFPHIGQIPPWYYARGAFGRAEAATLSTVGVDFINPSAAVNFGPLVGSPVLGGLKRFSFEQVTYSGDDRLRGLAALPFRRLERLEMPLMGGNRAEVGLFLKAEWVRRLQDVRLTANPNAVVEPLLTGLAGLPRLHTLHLNGCRHFSIAALNRKHRFPSLGRLELADVNLRGEQADALAACHFPRLAALGLQGNVPASAVKKLAAADWFPGLRSLWINSSQLNDSGVKLLKAAPHLRALMLYGPVFGEGGFEVVATAFPELRSLELWAGSESEDDPSAAERFLARLLAPHLRHLTLRNVRLPLPAVQALAGNSALSNLTMLCLENAAMTAEGVTALVTSPHLQRLIGLTFLGHSITKRTTGGEGLAALLDPALLPNLVRCGMPNGVSDELREKLEASRPGCQFV